MQKKFFILGLFLAAVFMLAGCSKYPVVDENAKIIFFFGVTCPHCKNVEKFFEENKVEEKIEFEQAEVYTVKANEEIMRKKAAICQIPEKELGVPMLWNDGQCLVGDEDIIKFFKEKLNETK